MTALFECQNCRAEWREEQLKDIHSVAARVAPGEPMPAGECPACGALCHEVVKVHYANATTTVPVVRPILDGLPREAWRISPKGKYIGTDEKNVAALLVPDVRLAQLLAAAPFLYRTIYLLVERLSNEGYGTELPICASDVADAINDHWSNLVVALAKVQP